MTINILIGIDPFGQPGVDKIYNFDTKQELIEFVRTWVYNDLTKCSNLISGKDYHINERTTNFINAFQDTNELKYKSMNDSLCEYEYKWLMYQL